MRVEYSVLNYAILYYTTLSPLIVPYSPHQGGAAPAAEPEVVKPEGPTQLYWSCYSGAAVIPQVGLGLGLGLELGLGYSGAAVSSQVM